MAETILQKKLKTLKSELENLDGEEQTVRYNIEKYRIIREIAEMSVDGQSPEQIEEINQCIEYIQMQKEKIEQKEKLEIEKEENEIA